MCCAVSALALDPNRAVSQYMRNSWGTENGLSGTVSSITQTSDGYLWIGTDDGLIRFDGLNFHKFEQADSASFAIGPVREVLTDKQGTLWILLQNTKLLRYHDGTFSLARGEAENGITALSQGTGNAILLSSLAMGTLTYNGNRFSAIASLPASSDSESLAAAENEDERSTRLSWSTGLTPHHLAVPSAVISMAATNDDKIWLGTADRGLFYQKDGQVSLAAGGRPGMKVNCLLPGDDSELWIGTNQGVLRWSRTQLGRPEVPSPLVHDEVLSMIRDRDSNIWVGTSRGLFRFNAKGAFFLPADGASTDAQVTALFEDREGNIWVGGRRHLERLRDSAFVTYSVPDLQAMGSVYVDPDDYTWFGTLEPGLRWLKEAKQGTVTVDGLNHDVVYSITGREQDLWLGRQQGGLTHLSDIHGVLSAKTYTMAQGLAQNSVYAVYESRDGAVWAGTLSGGLSELSNGHLTNYTTANGLPSNTVSSIAEGADGSIWVGTPNGLSAKSRNAWRTYKASDGLPSEDINCLLPDSSGVLWIGTAEGLAFSVAGRCMLL